MPVPTKQMYRSGGQSATDRRHEHDPGRWRGEMARNVPQAGYTAVRIYSAQALDRLPFCHLAELEEGPRRTSDASWLLPPRRASERQRRSAQSFCALHECAAAPLRVPGLQGARRLRSLREADDLPLAHAINPIRAAPAPTAHAWTDPRAGQRRRGLHACALLRCFASEGARDRYRWSFVCNQPTAAIAKPSVYYSSYDS